ncbi:unannotated protein [freshwater metagenome]|uniref:Unannotated protein n=1 Tax=freshwater metagenome TaxID=449393 RepID=A0A6J6RFF1_9ZZZZ
MALFAAGIKSLEESIEIREVTVNDEFAILEIRNHPENFKWFLNDSSVSIDEHSEWFKSRLDKSKFFTLIAESKDEILGIAYLSDPTVYSPRVSISIKPGSKGKGVGSSLLKELIRRSKSVNLESLSAEIKGGNCSSISLFSRSGFVMNHLESEIQEVRAFGVLRLILNLNS